MTTELPPVQPANVGGTTTQPPSALPANVGGTTPQSVHTNLLPPVCALHLAWALTGDFAKETESKDIANMARKYIGDIESQAAKASAQERDYVRSAMSLVTGSIRSLDVAYKARELNFKENEQLRTAYLTSFQESLEFGKKLQDFVRSIPSMAIVTGAGTLTINELWGSRLPGWGWAAVVVGLAAAGHVVNIIIVQVKGGLQAKSYMKQDFDRGTYFDQYVARVRSVLVSLYTDIDRVHNEIFGQYYDRSVDAAKVTKELLEGVKNTRCQKVQAHMEKGKISPAIWARCEAGGDAAEACSLSGQ
jgi:hypothetical protein